MAIKQNLSPDEIINEIETALKGYSLHDIRTVLNAKLPIAGFILCSCLIDHMAGFHFARSEKNGKITGSRTRYIDFIDKYMKPNYGHDGKLFYDQLRCQVVHAYTSSNAAFAFDLMTDQTEKSKNWTFPAARQRLDLATFVSQLEDVVDRFLNDIKTDAAIQQVAIDMYKKYGIFSENP
jgi:hypothetical protein